MEIGSRVVFLVAEPWDFTSPMGANRITGIICDKTIVRCSKYRTSEAFLLRSDEVFDINSHDIWYISSGISV